MPNAFVDLQVLADRGAVFAELSQQLLNDGLEERLGQYTWDVDLLADTITFAAKSSAARIVAGVELIASVAPGPRSLLWGRALPAGGRSGAQRLLERGRAEGLPSLLADEVPFPVSGDTHHAAALAAREISAVTATVTDGGLTSVMPTGGGTCGVLLIDRLDFAIPRIDHRLPMRLTTVLTDGRALDQKAATHGLAVMAGWAISWAPDWGVARLSDPVTGNTAELTFGTHNVLTNFTCSMGPAA